MDDLAIDDRQSDRGADDRRGSSREDVAVKDHEVPRIWAIRVAHRASPSASRALTAGHSGEMTLKKAESRSEPSGMIVC